MPNEAEKNIHQTSIEFTPEFKRSLRRLARKYRHIKSDVEPLIESLLAGEEPGDRIQRTGRRVYKARVASSDLQ